MAPTNGNFTFRKEERLTSLRVIEQLYKSPSSGAFRYPFRAGILFIPLPTTAFPAQLLVSVSARKFRKAHDRNRIKRQIREIYRLHKQVLYEQLKEKNIQAAVLITYIGKEAVPFLQMKTQLISLLKELPNTYEPVK